LQQSGLHGVQSCSGAGGDTGLCIDVFNVVACGFRANSKIPTDLASGRATGEEHEHLDLSPAKPLPECAIPTTNNQPP
jgi:hypothetical protein